MVSFGRPLFPIPAISAEISQPEYELYNRLRKTQPLCRLRKSFANLPQRTGSSITLTYIRLIILIPQSSGETE